MTEIETLGDLKRWLELHDVDMQLTFGLVRGHTCWIRKDGHDVLACSGVDFIAAIRAAIHEYEAHHAAS